MKKIKNNNGFTLVELLAVIVILALIMGIAVVSMSGITENAKINVMKSTATSLADGFGKLALMNGDLNDSAYFKIGEGLLEKKSTSPWGEYVFKTDASIGYEKVTGLTAESVIYCGHSTSAIEGSFIHAVKDSNGRYSYSICLYDAANHYIYADLNTLLKSDAKDKNDFFKDAAGKYGISGGKIQTIAE